MKKLLKCTLILVMVLSSLLFTVVACENGNDADNSSVTQSTQSDKQQSEDDKPEQPSSEQEKPTQSDEPQGGTQLPGGLVDMGNFESKQ